MDIETDISAEEKGPPTTPPLSYAFARMHGVVVAEGAEGKLVLAHRPGASREALLEARRAFGGPILPEPMPSDAFSNLVAKTYSQSTLTAQLMPRLETPKIYRNLPQAYPKPLTYWMIRMMRTLFG